MYKQIESIANELKANWMKESGFFGNVVDFDALDKEREEIVSRAKELGIWSKVYALASDMYWKD